jgi:hypothetical protein
MNTDNEFHAIQIFAGYLYDAAMVKYLLQCVGIEVFHKDEITGTISIWQSMPGRSGYIILLVLPKDYNEATQILEEFEKKEGH